MATPGKAVPSAARIRRWAGATLARPAEIAVRIVGAAEARRLNLRYGGRDYATNVLSFAYGTTDGALRGDIVLCLPVIAREARVQRKTLEAHLAHLTVHGLLHLQGYDHERSARCGAHGGAGKEDPRQTRLC